jgi:hypothetical protein
VSAKPASFALLLVLSAAAARAAGPSAHIPLQLLPLPSIAAPPAPAPLPPPTNPGFAPAPPNGLSPLLSEPGPAFPLPQEVPSTAYPALPLPGPIDQQKVGSYRMWLQGQQRLMERGGVSPDDYLGRQIQQQLLQSEPPAGSR